MEDPAPPPYVMPRGISTFTIDSDSTASSNSTNIESLDMGVYLDDVVLI